MDILDWIAASKQLRFTSKQTEKTLRAQFRRHRARGFIADFTEAPIVAEERGNKITLRRTSSFWGGFGLRCSVTVRPQLNGSRVDARIWHGPLLTAWICLNYSAALVILAGFAIAALLNRNGIGERSFLFIVGIVIAVFWVGLTAVVNAALRVQQKHAIQELLTVITAIAKEVRSPEPSSTQTEVRRASAK